MSKDETIAELKRQIRAYEATVHNLNLQLEAAGAGEVQAPVAWRLWDDEPGDTPRWVYYDISDFKEGINPESIFDGLNPLFDKPQPAPSIGAEGLSADATLLDVCTDPNNCKRCNTHPHHRDGLAHAGIPAAALAAQKGGAA